MLGFLKFIGLSTFILVGISFADDEEVVIEKPHFFISSQFGQLAKYKLRGSEEVAFQWQKRFGGLIELNAVYGKNTLMSTGLFGGMFNVLPEAENAGFTGSNWTRSFTGLSHGFIKHHLGDVSNPRATLQFGRFNYKYNTSASNLGEYLFRSFAYPKVVLSGGLLPVHYSASTMLDGLKFSLKTGPFEHDMLLTTETQFNPFNDFSFTTISKATFGKIFSVGGGIQFDKFLSVRPSKTTSVNKENSYIDTTISVNYSWVNLNGDTIAENVTLNHFLGTSTIYEREQRFYDNMKEFEDSLLLNPQLVSKYGRTGNANLRENYAKEAGKYSALMDIGLAFRQNDSVARKHYTFSSIKVMGLASLDLYPLLGSSTVFGEKDLRLFAEVSVLGVKNYPILYDNIYQRIPVMFGVSIPTFSNLFRNTIGFSLLDYAEAQFEYFRNDDPISTIGIAGGTATPDGKGGYGGEDIEGEYYNAKLYRDDDWKYSFLIGKKLSKVLEIRAQVARDHFIPYDQNYFFGRGVQPQDVLISKNHWYWMTDVSFGF